MKSFLLYLLPVFLLLAACSKQDIEPAPIGQPVPGEKGADKTWQEVINNTTYTLFRSALQRADMADMLKSTANSTVLVPDDKAFTAAGWTATRINNATPAELKALLSYHIIPMFLTPSSLETVVGNIPAVTMSKRPMDGREGWYSDYTDVLFLGKHGDSLLVNGCAESKWGTAIQASNGIIFPINHVLEAPQQTMWEYIQSVPEYSMYVAALLISDSLYNESYITLGVMPAIKSAQSVAQFTLFVPTNNAFAKAGFHTPQDILDYCMRSYPLPYPDYDEHMYYQQPTTAMDSILMANGLEVSNALQIYGNMKGGPVFFSNDLTDNAKQLSWIQLLNGQPYNTPPVYISLDFKVDNGQPWVKRHGVNQPYISLAKKDHRVTNGVVHEVDDLFLLPN
ncbi:fasciclin domain-containing protein [Chitinophaga sp. Hz27]|uniref:fasciclin domain-containing protein n=1 Tax=Chitinophaga sp. Hz27 TaxID=3347169 RepID=UPI0035E24001